MGQFYWLKLKKDFFKKHKIVILRSMENGLMYESIFIHLMAESIDHDAKLRFSDSKPYTPKTLAPLVGTDSKTMSDALEIFADLELIEILEDGTIFVPLASENIGSATDNANANRQRRYRERQAEQAKNNADDTASVTECNGKRYGSVTKRNERLEIRDKRKEIRKIENYRSLSGRPNFSEIELFVKEKGLAVDPQAFFDYYEKRDWQSNGETIKNWQALCISWNGSDIKPKKTKKKEDLPILENTYDQETLENMVGNPLEDLQKAILKK